MSIKIQDTGRIDPRNQGAAPNFPQGKMPYPGLTADMNPKPDHGEETYRGSGRLKERWL